MKKIFRIQGVILIIVLVFSSGCEKSDQGQLPEIFTSGVDIVTPTSAICSGNITSRGDSTFSEKGFCWNTGHLPVIKDNKLGFNFQDIGKFSVTITGLRQQTDYYVRAYATNNTGTAYGEELTFTTPADHTGETGTVEDADGNDYQTIGIGSQIWMVENLKTTKYRNGDLIGTTTPDTLDISGESTPKYQWAYAGDESNVAPYGRLYTWYAITDTRNVCPAGWHVPINVEWTILATFLGKWTELGGKLAETGTAHWLTPNTGATNETGFTALPGGQRFNYGGFNNIGYFGWWWSSTNDSMNSTSYAQSQQIYYSDFYHFINWRIQLYENKETGYSVRCLRD